MRPNFRRIAYVSLLTTLALSIQAISFAQTCTMEVNQNDPSATYKTINAAITVATPGSVICVHPGVYEESVTVSGVTLKALKGPEVTVIQSPDGTGTGATLTGNQNVAIIGFRVQGFATGINPDTNGGDTKISNCIATGNSGNGFVLGSSMPQSAKIVNNISADNGDNGFYTSISGANLMSFFNNIAYRNGNYGLYGGGYLDAKWGDYSCTFGNTSGDRKDSQVGAHHITSDPLIDSTKHYRFTSQSSPCVNTGHPASFYLDPDGSISDMGAYGGPESRNWWRDPFNGPVVENVTVDPPQVVPGGTITIRATARTE